MVDPAVSRLDSAAVTLIGVRPASEIIDQLGPRHYLHGGPPIDLGDIPGPMRGALIGALILEGQAANPEEAAGIIDAREVAISPCHDAGAVGAMAGIVTPSMPCVLARCDRSTVLSPLNEGLGSALRFGCYDDQTLSRLRWLRSTAGPVLDAAIRDSAEIDLVDVISEGLRRGDECHNRNVATSALLVALLAPEIVRSTRDRADAAEVLTFASGNRHFGLPFSMCAAKAIADSAQGFSGSSVVTAMSSNGHTLGIRVSGAGTRWFHAPAPLGEPVLFEGYTRDDATPAIGDSMITETAGYGAFALTAAPAITAFVGGNAETSRRLVARMRGICAATSSRFLIPSEDFRGTPLGIDVHRVRETGTAPVMNNGIAHREAGRGQVGAGITQLPIEPFVAASEFLLGNGRRDAAAAGRADQPG
jgi:Protein of unknown function (DUF1116)